MKDFNPVSFGETLQDNVVQPIHGPARKVAFAFDVVNIHIHHNTNTLSLGLGVIHNYLHFHERMKGTLGARG